MRDISFMGAPQRRLLRREATGVVGAITPWNFPLYLNLAKLGPALAAGCTIVLKPAPDTPWCATHIGRLIAEKTDIPAGVVNIVASSDHLTGEILSTDPRVDLVTFTGSTATGRRVMECASPTMKKVFLELGGKSANIVLDDADFATALPFGAMTCAHGGQGCAITTRLLLPRSRYDEGLRSLQKALRELELRRPDATRHLQGPQICSASRSACSATSRRARRRARAWSSAAACRSICRRASTSSRRCSPTSTPTRPSRRRRSSVRCSA